MENKFLCLMAGYDDDTENHLAGIQEKLYAVGLTGEHTKNIPQHITLQTYSAEREVELVQMLETIAEETQSFDVCFSHIGIFTGGKELFIASDKDTDLIALKESFGSSFDWTPQPTMLIDEPENIQKAVPLVMKEFSSFHGKVTSLHLHEFWPTRHISTVYLGGSMIREANSEDLSQILELYLHLHETAVPEESEELRCTWEKIMTDDHHLIVCEVDGKIVSSCVCVIIPNLTRGVRPYAFVENVVTHSQHRGEGYATACLNYARELAQKENCYKMMLLSGSKSPETLAFYQNAGYNSTDKTAFIQWL